MSYRRVIVEVMGHDGVSCWVGLGLGQWAHRRRLWVSDDWMIYAGHARMHDIFGTSTVQSVWGVIVV